MTAVDRARARLQALMKAHEIEALELRAAHLAEEISCRTELLARLEEAMAIKDLDFMFTRTNTETTPT